MALTKIPSSLLDTSGGFDLQGNITLGDNEQIQLGDSTDLAIYHDGSHSFITDSGTGNLRLQGTNLALQNAAGTKNYFLGSDGGAVILYHDNSVKLETTSTGATVTGNLAVTGDLDITGNVNSYNVTDLDVTDQTITLGAGQTEANSGGSGIIIDGSSASILWNETDSVFDFNKDISLDNGLFFSEQDFYLYRSAADVATLRVGDSGSYKYFQFTDTGTVARFSSASGAVSLGSGANDHLLINSSGLVMIGTTTPSGLLNVDGNLHYGGQLRVNDPSHDGTESNPSICVGYDNDNGFFRPTSNTIGMTTAGTERMRITATGNVGIGTTSPQDTLHVITDSSTTNDTVDVARIEATSSGTPAVGFGPTIDFRGERAGASSDSMGRIGFVADVMTASRIDGAYVVETAIDGTYSERMRIDSSGKVHIGAISGTGLLNVDGGTGEGSLYVEGTFSGAPITARLLASDGGAVFFGSSSNHDLRIQTNGANRMFITTSGTMGFGMSPLGTNNGSAFFDGNVSSKDGFMTTASDLKMIAPSAGNTIFVRDNGNESMRILSNGVILIGTTTQSGISNTTTNHGISIGGGGQYVVNTDNDTNFIINRSNGTGNHIQFRYNGGNTGSISTNGSTVSYNTGSDYRLKENVDYDFNALDRVAQLKPARFNFIADADTTVDGFLAHEVSGIVPEAIHGEKDAVNSEGNPEYQGIDQSKLVPLLTKAIQELKTELDAAKARITELEG